MSNLEHLIENGLSAIARMNHDEWKEFMIKDCNWLGNEHISIDELWTICQYVEYTYIPHLRSEIDELREKRWLNEYSI
jgi:hypothetical protein